MKGKKRKKKKRKEKRKKKNRRKKKDETTPKRAAPPWAVAAGRRSPNYISQRPPRRGPEVAAGARRGLHFPAPHARGGPAAISRGSARRRRRQDGGGGGRRSRGAGAVRGGAAAVPAARSEAARRARARRQGEPGGAAGAHRQPGHGAVPHQRGPESGARPRPLREKAAERAAQGGAGQQHPAERTGAAAEAEPQRGQGDGAEKSPAGGRRWLPPGPARQVRLPPRHRAGSEAAAPPPGVLGRSGSSTDSTGHGPAASGCRNPWLQHGGGHGEPPRWGCRGCSASWGLRLLRLQGWRQGNKGRLVLGGAVWVCNAARSRPRVGLGPPRQHLAWSGSPQPHW